MIRDAVATDFPAIVGLNRESEHFLSPLILPRLVELHGRAAWHRAQNRDEAWNSSNCAGGGPGRGLTLQV